MRLLLRVSLCTVTLYLSFFLEEEQVFSYFTGVKEGQRKQKEDKEDTFVRAVKVRFILIFGSFLGLDVFLMLTISYILF